MSLDKGITETFQKDFSGEPGFWKIFNTQGDKKAQLRARNNAELWRQWSGAC